MKKSMDIVLSRHFGMAIAVGYRVPEPRLPIAHAAVRYYARGDDTAIVQEYDGHYGYLYSYDMHLSTGVHLPMRADRADLHVLYFMEGPGDLLLSDAHGGTICRLSPYRACYLYLPAGDYRLCFPTGECLLFGFYFDGGIFRDGNERPFGFLSELIAAYRTRSAIAVVSIDFAVGPRTLAHIQYLFAHLHRGHLDNEAFLQHSLIRLIELSREKVLAERETLSEPRRLIEIAQKILAEHIALNGNSTQIKHIALQLRISPEYLSRLHRIYYQQTIRDYRAALLLQRIKELLAQTYTLLDISLQCGFQGSGEMTRFFRKQTGMTPAQYRRLLQTG